MGHSDAAVFASQGSPVAPFHVGGGRCFVDEDDSVGVKVELALKPGLPRRHHVGTALLARVNSPFFRVMPWRAKKRCSPLVLVATPCSRKVSRNSRR